jgi:glycosyltransferase involved in cell wall biosynthesis
MRICILGKYPPIEGGVSAHTYWLARGVAERGHEIHVVTNADEVEDMYRLTLTPNDWQWYQPSFASTGGRVLLHNATSFNRRTMDYIPCANPFVSKLASLATDIVRSYDCQVILAYYYEPYAVAGWLASRWTCRPLLVKHAGSDLDRLFGVPDLATTYKEILRSAEGVVTQPKLIPRFLGMGVRQDRLYHDVPYSVPTEVFHPQAELLDIAELALPSLIEEAAATPGKFNPKIPSIGIYGKVGQSKGTFDLISALGILAREGTRFNLLAMVGKAQGEKLIPALRDAELLTRTYVIPLLPNWKVPSFIRVCTAVCFLERDFPVEIHGPIVPREVFACGTCLILSEEIARKQRYREELTPGRNVVMVKDPRDHVNLAIALSSVLTYPNQALEIGARGVRISRLIENYSTYTAGWEQMFARHISAESYVSPLASGEPRRFGTSPSDALQLTVPEIVSLLLHRSSGLIEEFLQQSLDGNPFGIAVQFCEFVIARLTTNLWGNDLPQFVDVVRYSKARLISMHDPPAEFKPPFFVVDRLHGKAVSEQTVWGLRPIRSNSIRVEEFDYDVSGLFIHLATSFLGLVNNLEEGVAAVRKERTFVLFQRSVNLVPGELRIDEATRELVSACDGTRTTEGLVQYFFHYFSSETFEQHEETKTKVISALDRLYRARVIVFGEQPSGWGWIGGERGSF